eukprot:bmy_08933T0
MRAQGPQVRVMGARPLGRAIWQRLPRQAWALQCVPCLEKFPSVLTPYTPEPQGDFQAGQRLVEPQGGRPSRDRCQRGPRGQRGGLGVLHHQSAPGRGLGRRAQGRCLVRSPPRTAAPRSAGRRPDSEHSTFLAAEGPGWNSRCFILQKPQALHPRAPKGLGVDSSRPWGCGGRGVTASSCPLLTPPRPGWALASTPGVTQGSSLSVAMTDLRGAQGPREDSDPSPASQGPRLVRRNTQEGAVSRAGGPRPGGGSAPQGGREASWRREGPGAGHGGLLPWSEDQLLPCPSSAWRAPWFLLEGQGPHGTMAVTEPQKRWLPHLGRPAQSGPQDSAAICTPWNEQSWRGLGGGS